jgi:hypothetical protein
VLNANSFQQLLVVGLASVSVDLPLGVPLPVPSNTFVFTFDQLLIFDNVEPFNLKLNTTHFYDVMFFDFVLLALIFVHN